MEHHVNSQRKINMKAMVFLKGDTEHKSRFFYYNLLKSKCSMAVMFIVHSGCDISSAQWL